MNLFQIEAYKMFTESPDQSMFFPHTHDSCEIFCFLSGDAFYSVEGNIYPLTPGDIVILRNSETHHLTLKSNAPYKRISIYFKPNKEMEDTLVEILLTAFLERPIGIYNFYSAENPNSSNWQYYLNKICDTDNDIKKQIYLMTFLQEITEHFGLMRKQPVNPSSNIVIRVTHYIDRHLTDTLNLDIICTRFYISKAQLNRYFKKNLGTTVGEYISTKRLFLAHDLIQEGERPTTAYLKCGFNDYSAFFRAYKKKFGHKPRNTTKNKED